MQYWPALSLIQQVAAELGLPTPTTLVGSSDVQLNQLVALSNAAGNELLTFYTWEQFIKEWNWPTVDAQPAYDLPDDWLYFTDQTQWDRTNHWPLLGPKSPQEWAWLKGGLLAAAPKMRYRVYQDQFWLWPVPGSSSFDIAMEYVVKNWVLSPSPVPDTPKDMIATDGDVVMYHPWLFMKFLKLKFYELKGFDTTAPEKDFMRIFQSMTGKSKGAPKLSLAPLFPPLFIGPWSIPDGSWDTGATGP
jgi:hypothetical protein